jgi:hypothetical protein
VGDRQSGKSNLILKLLDLAPGSEGVKETVALDFKYGTKQQDEAAVMLHCYELGGGRVLGGLLKSPLSQWNLCQTTSVCITIDLSRPAGAVETLLFWVNLVKEHLNSALQSLQQSHLEQFREIKRQATDYWSKVPAQSEKGRLSISLVPITVVAAKYDHLAKNCEPSQKKLLCRALRYVCHSHGCHLVFASALEQKPLRNFKRLLLWQAFREQQAAEN